MKATVFYSIIFLCAIYTFQTHTMELDLPTETQENKQQALLSTQSHYQASLSYQQQYPCISTANPSFAPSSAESYGGQGKATEGRPKPQQLTNVASSDDVCVAIDLNEDNNSKKYLNYLLKNELINQNNYGGMINQNRFEEMNGDMSYKVSLGALPCVILLLFGGFTVTMLCIIAAKIHLPNV